MSGKLVTIETSLDNLEHRDASTVDNDRGLAVSSRLPSHTGFYFGHVFLSVYKSRIRHVHVDDGASPNAWNCVFSYLNSC
jgi:hypothetical protein